MLIPSFIRNAYNESIRNIKVISDEAPAKKTDMAREATAVLEQRLVKTIAPFAKHQKSPQGKKASPAKIINFYEELKEATEDKPTD